MLAGITGSRAAAALVVLGPISQATDWFPGLSDWLFARFDPEAVTPTTPAAFAVVAVLGLTLIYLMFLTGFVRCLSGCPIAETAHLPLEATATVSLFLILRAFSMGAVALTGVALPVQPSPM